MGSTITSEGLRSIRGPSQDSGSRHEVSFPNSSVTAEPRKWTQLHLAVLNNDQEAIKGLLGGPWGNPMMKVEGLPSPLRLSVQAPEDWDSFRLLFVSVAPLLQKDSEEAPRCPRQGPSRMITDSVIGELVREAARANNVRVLEFLLSRVKCELSHLLNARDPDSGQTPLLCACSSGSLEAAKFLLEKGANPWIVDRLRRGVLHHIAIGGCHEILKLLEFPGKIYDPPEDVNGDTPMSLAAKRRNFSFVLGHFGPERELFRRPDGLPVAPEDTLKLALAHGLDEAASSFMAQNCWLPNQRKYGLEEDLEFLEQAVSKDMLQSVKLFLKSGLEPREGENGRSSLVDLAAKHGAVEVLKFLVLEFGRTEISEEATLLSSRLADTRCLQFLLAQDSKNNGNRMNEDLFARMLVWNNSSPSREALQFLLSRNPTFAKLPDLRKVLKNWVLEGRADLVSVCVQRGCELVLNARMLLELAEKPESPETLFMWSLLTREGLTRIRGAEAWVYNMHELELKTGEDEFLSPGEIQELKAKLFLIACESRNPSILEYLIETCLELSSVQALIKPDGQSLLARSALSPANFGALVSTGFFSLDSGNRALLHEALDSRSLRWGLAAGIDVNTLDSRGILPITRALQESRSPSVFRTLWLAGSRPHLEPGHPGFFRFLENTLLEPDVLRALRPVIWTSCGYMDSDQLKEQTRELSRELLRRNMERIWRGLMLNNPNTLEMLCSEDEEVKGDGELVFRMEDWIELGPLNEDEHDVFRGFVYRPEGNDFHQEIEENNLLLEDEVEEDVPEVVVPYIDAGAVMPPPGRLNRACPALGR